MNAAQIIPCAQELAEEALDQWHPARRAYALLDSRDTDSIVPVVESAEQRDSDEWFNALVDIATTNPERGQATLRHLLRKHALIVAKEQLS